MARSRFECMSISFLGTGSALIFHLPLGALAWRQFADHDRRGGLYGDVRDLVVADRRVRDLAVIRGGLEDRASAGRPLDPGGLVFDVAGLKEDVTLDPIVNPVSR